MELGTVLDGKYCVERVVGRGGMGLVMAARHLQLHQQVALKLLLPGATRDPSLLERFLREARASAQLRGEHVCRVSDVGELADGTPYFVMELLDGRDLASLTPMPYLEAANYVLQACIGIAEAHALGMVHRDLKPANLFLTHRPDGSPLIKVLDFGIAKSHGDLDLALTTTAMILGSPGYMAPEHLRSTRSADVRSDIWSLGVILFELVSGRPPFNGESITDLAFKIAMDPTPPLDVAALPPGFEQVVRRCLEKVPAERFANLGQLAHALAPFAGPTGPELAAAVSRLLNLDGPSTAVGHGPATMAATSASAPTVSSPRTWMWIATCFGIMMVVAVIVIAVTRSHDRQADGRAPASGAIGSPAITPVDARASAIEPLDGPAPSAVEEPATEPAATDIAPVPVMKPARKRPRKPDARPTREPPTQEDLGEDRL